MLRVLQSEAERGAEAVAMVAGKENREEIEGEDVRIGLECHAQLLTKSKLFCGCSTDYRGAEPNTHCCEVCLGLPGALPVVNEQALKFALKVALALNCDIQPKTLFYRKNYFYPDLPRGFQISQYDFPIALNGYLSIESDGVERKIRIRRVHLEEDPGKLVYPGSITTAKYVLVDYNRSGVPLVEIVTEPDLRSPREARIFLAKLRSILEYLGVFNGDLEGAMRVDANISLGGGERVEVKNISSLKGVERALAFEITRQRNFLRRGQSIQQETRFYDEERGITVAMRTKEFEQDYRYFPEPDLVPIQISAELVDALKAEIPEMPDEKMRRFLRQYALTREQAKALTEDIFVADFYEAVASEIDARFAATWVADVLKGELNYRGMSMREALKRVSPENFVRLLKMLRSGEIAERAAVEILREMLDRGGSPEEILRRKHLKRLSSAEIEHAVDEVISEHAKAVSDFKAGKKEALNFLVGQVLKKTRGRADPKEARNILAQKLQ